MQKMVTDLLDNCCSFFFSVSVMPPHFLSGFKLLSMSFNVLDNIMCVSVVRWGLALCDSTVHGTFQARIPEWVAILLLQGIIPTQGLNPSLLSPAQPEGPLPAEPLGKSHVMSVRATLSASVV